MSAAEIWKNALVFTGGGTGGHFFPAVALAEGARERWPDLPIAFVGSTRGMEARRLPSSSWPHALLDVEGFLGRSPMAALRSLRKLWKARAELLASWKDARPWAIIATGGYASAPALMAARKLGIPYFIHESNAEPGLLVRLMARKARRVWCGMDAVMGRLPGAPCLSAGTPVRASFMRPFESVQTLEPPYRLLVLGGSGGARAINEAVMALAPALLERHPDWELQHQTGARDHAGLEARERHPRHHLHAFLENVDTEMETASLIISRSGASTCAELKACGRPAILVPMPGSAGDHQTMNARAMAGEGRAVLLPQTEALAVRLEEVLGRLLEDPAARTALARPSPNTSLQRCLDDLAATMA